MKPLKSMENYHPAKQSPSEVWLELDEQERIDLVQEFHEAANVQFEEGASTFHAVVHVIVENQVAMNEEPVPATLAKLIRQGLSRHEAIHAIGAVIAGDMLDILQNGKVFDPKKYRHRLNKLTAKRWLKGKY